MSKLNSYPWYISDWRGSEARLMSCEARGIYRELLDHHYDQGSLPNDQAQLQKIAAASDKEWKRSWPTVKAHFFESDGRLFNRKTVERLPELQRLAGVRQERAKKANEVRWGLDKDPPSNPPSNPQRNPPSNPPRIPEAMLQRSLATATATAIATASSKLLHPPAACDWLRQALIDFVGEDCDWPPPSTKILTQILDYTGSSEEDLTKLAHFLLAKMKTNRKPKNSWAWFLTVITEEFQVIPIKEVTQNAATIS